jgi:hypothetical protein
MPSPEWLSFIWRWALEGVLMLELPDWDRWGRLKTVTLRDALVLSAGLCPHKYNHENTNSIELSYAQKFWDNLQIAKNHAYESGWVVGEVATEDFDVDFNNTVVDLKKFSIWAATVVELPDLPPEMVIIGDLLLVTQTQAEGLQHQRRNHSNDEVWKGLAIGLAQELRASSTAGRHFLSLDDLADRIEEHFANQTPPIVGTNGHRLKASTIKRHALIGLF